MKKNKDNKNNRFPFLLKLDKNSIKLQLKDLGKKFSFRRTKSKRISILLLIFLLIGVGIAIYNNDYNLEKKADEDSRIIIEPIISQESSFSKDRAEDNNKLIIKENNYHLNYDSVSEMLENEQDSQNTDLSEDVVTQSLKPLKKKVADKINLLKPVSGEILQEAGWYYHPVFGDWRYQPGIEFKGNLGDIVMAAASGRVRTVKEDPYKGILVTVEHENNWQTQYGHLQRASVSSGELVGKGQEIGRIGKTGVSSESSLYFVFNSPDGSIDPTDYFE